MKVATRLTAPTRQEYKEHHISHWPTRDWCEHCTKGKGVSDDHLHHPDKEAPEDPTVSLDYCFMGPEEAESDMIPVLVLFDNKSKGIWALPVTEKGANEATVNWVADTIEEMGYGGTKVILKSDQEPAMLSLKKAVAVARQAET